MKKLALIALLFASAGSFAQNAVTEGAVVSDKLLNAPIPANSTVVFRQALGSGTLGFTSVEPATHMGEGIYHAPQYMPTYPTAGVIWPRVVDVECEKSPTGTFVCGGYNWSPAMGRGEYLYIRPYVKAKAAPVVVEKLVPVPTPYPVYVEKKPKKE